MIYRKFSYILFLIICSGQLAAQEQVITETYYYRMEYDWLEKDTIVSWVNETNTIVIDAMDGTGIIWSNDNGEVMRLYYYGDFSNNFTDEGVSYVMIETMNSTGDIIYIKYFNDSGYMSIFFPDEISVELSR